MIANVLAVVQQLLTKKQTQILSSLSHSEKLGANLNFVFETNHSTVQVSALSNGVWGAAKPIGRGTAFSSFKEVLSLDAASTTVAGAVWKNAKTGTQTMATSYGK